MKEPGSKTTIYLTAERMEVVDRIRAEMLKYGTLISLSAIVGRLIDEGAENIVLHPFAPRIRESESRLDAIETEMRALRRSGDVAGLNRLQKEVSRMLADKQVLIKRLQLGHPRQRGRLHGDYDSCESLIGRLAATGNELLNASLAAGSKGGPRS